MTGLLSLNGIDVVKVRLFTPWDGVWLADVELDTAVPLPSLVAAPCVLTIGTNALVGFIDPAASGVFGARASCRVVGGFNGWGRTVLPLDFHNDAGVLSSAVIAATAAEVGEKAIVAIPQLLGVDYMRAAGPASRCLDGLDWHVDLFGVTQVAPRVPFPANPLTVEVLDFDPTQQVATIATDGILVPGTILVDPRFGTLTVRDVEQTWSGDGARARAWCGPSSVSRLAGAMTAFVKSAVRLEHLKTYKYRVVAQGPDGRVILQPIEIFGDMPTTLPISIWPGMSGISALLTPATECLVHFIEGDPAQPYVLGFSSTGKPIALLLDALTFVACGDVAPLAVARMPGLTTWALEVEAALAATGHPILPPGDWHTLAPAITSTKLVTD